MRELYRLRFELDDAIREDMSNRISCFGMEWFKEVGIERIIREIDTTNPILVLRPNGIYERHTSLEKWYSGTTYTTWLKANLNIPKYLDSLLEGKKVTPPKGPSWELDPPIPVKVVIDFAGGKYDDYFNSRTEVYDIKEKRYSLGFWSGRFSPEPANDARQ